MINKDILGKIDTLVSELIGMKNEYQTKLSEKENAIINLIEELEQRASDLEKLEIKAGEVTTSIKEKETRVAKIIAESDKIDNRLEKATTDVKNVEIALNELKPRLEHQKECSSKIDDFLSNQIHIDKAVSNAKVILSQIQEKTESLGTILKNLEKQTQALQQTQVSTCNDMYKVKTDINQGLDDIAKLKEALSEIGSYIANSMQTEIKIDQFLKEQQNHQDAIKKLQQTLTEIDRKVTNLKYGAASLENDISVSKNNYYKSKEDLIRIQQQVSNYFSNSERFKNYVLDVVSENLYVQHVTLNNRLFIYKK